MTTMISGNWWASPEQERRVVQEKREGSPDGVEEAYRKIAKTMSASSASGWPDVLGKYRSASRENNTPSTTPVPEQNPTQQQQHPTNSISWGEAMGQYSRQTSTPTVAWATPVVTPENRDIVPTSRPPVNNMGWGTAPVPQQETEMTPFQEYKLNRSCSSPGSSPGGGGMMPTVSPGRMEPAEGGMQAPPPPAVQTTHALREAEDRAERLQQQVDELQRMLRSQQTPAYRPPLPPKRPVSIPPVPQQHQPHPQHQPDRPLPRRSRSSSAHKESYHRGRRASNASTLMRHFDNVEYEIPEDLTRTRSSSRRGRTMAEKLGKENFNYGKHLVKLGNIENKYSSQWADTLREPKVARTRPQWNANLKRDIGWQNIGDYDRSNAFVDQTDAVRQPTTYATRSRRGSYYDQEDSYEDEEEDHRKMPQYGYPPDYY
eukprot:TRINITY_DN35255_c0_g1_i1.p1 TRINITY_DN35255_c0_g1~~TRINITY_DN35255_c0_g1_i1.p1  ORF type:complete len:430 (+),score=52.91 TRINITY_DN35255_c0_g1_i1:72-1361(+)